MLKIASVPIFKETGENTRPTRHADRGGVVMPVENHAVRGELIDLRRLHIVVSVAAKRVDGLIVGEKKDEVGLFLRRERGRHREQEKNGGED